MVLLLTLITVILEFGNGLASNLGSTQLQQNPGRLAFLVRHPFVTGAVLIVLAAVFGAGLWRVSDEKAVTGEIDIFAEVDRAVEVLAVKLRNEGLEWEALHLVDRPASLPVRWTNAPERLVAPWSAIRRSHNDSSPVALAGAIEQIAEVFSRVPSGRLVMLGAGGSGKTVIATRFMLSLLPAVGQKLAGKPLPVLFSLASWDPDLKRFLVWLADELVIAEPTLGRLMPGGNRLAEELLAHGRILPILDGLDEMASRVRATALEALSGSLRRHDQVLVTCRLAEYSAAVGQVGPLAEAAVVVINDLQAADLAEYLGEVREAGPRGAWSSVLARLATADPGSPVAALREVFKTPLMVFMARTVYHAAGADSEDLLTIGDANDIRTELLKRFVPAAYDEGPGTRTTWRAHNRVIKAERYLGTLATHMADRGMINFRWWQLHQGLNRRDQARLAVMVAVVATGLLMLLVTPFDITASTLDAPSLGILLGCLAGIGIRRPSLLGRMTPPVPVHMRGWRSARTAAGTTTLRVVTRGSIRGFAWRFGLLVGATSGLVWEIPEIVGAHVLSAFEFVNVMFSTAIPIALVAWFAARLAQSVEEPVDLARALGPLDLLRLDRSAAVLEASVYGIAAATIGAIMTPMLGLFISLLSHPRQLLHVNLHSASLYVINGVAIAMIETPVVVTFVLLFLLTAWGRFTLARLNFAVTGQLPWRLMTFLDDAHRRGILRQAGAVYQFRHVEIRNNLAGKPNRSAKSS